LEILTTGAGALEIRQDSSTNTERELRRLLWTLDSNERVYPSRLKVGQWLDTTRAEISPKHTSAMSVAQEWFGHATVSTTIAL
jgi:hypothetical protein